MIVCTHVMAGFDLMHKHLLGIMSYGACGIGAGHGARCCCRAEILKHSFNRPNLQYICKSKDALALSKTDLKQEMISDGVAKDIADFIIASRSSGIVYARTRCDVPVFYDLHTHANLVG